MAAKKTSYIDAEGLRQTGYIIDGSTYTDPAGTQPVARGSIVEAGGQRYVKGVGQNGQSMLYSDYLKAQGMSATDYVNPLGELKTGYIKDGQTYADILGTKPVETGSIVSAGSQQWVKGVGKDGESMLYSDYLKLLGQQSPAKPDTEGGNSAESSDPLAKMMEEAREAYEKSLSSNQELYKAQLEKGAADREKDLEALNAAYKDMNTQLYRDYMLERKNLPSGPGGPGNQRGTQREQPFEPCGRVSGGAGPKRAPTHFRHRGYRELRQGFGAGPCH